MLKHYSRQADNESAWDRLRHNAGVIWNRVLWQYVLHSIQYLQLGCWYTDQHMCVEWIQSGHPPCWHCDVTYNFKRADALPFPHFWFWLLFCSSTIALWYSAVSIASTLQNFSRQSGSSWYFSCTFFFFENSDLLLLWHTAFCLLYSGDIQTSQSNPMFTLASNKSTINFLCTCVSRNNSFSDRDKRQIVSMARTTELRFSQFYAN